MLVSALKGDGGTKDQLPAQMQIYMKSEKLKKDLEEAKQRHAKAKGKEKARLDSLYQLRKCHSLVFELGIMIVSHF